ncbi:MAG: DegT/DnrJ/EryC1/StrS family aminotransferase [Candidatus Daviesbacteria bacterium]|nr:DegT/DnrJ/EryC1/StrS family aminotransferase [Candidatus Daviesbacteria bacterium]
MKINLGELKVSDQQREIINNILDSGRITEGPYSRQFEEEFAKYTGVKHCIVCTNGTAGLMLVLQVLRNLADKPMTFLVPALTFPATLNAVILTGHNAVLCDVGEDLQIDVDEKTIVEKNIDGIIPVHLMGYPCNMDRILELKERYGLFVIEDACESFGSSFNGKKVGSFGNCGVFSGYASHTVGVGEFGCITTDNDELATMIHSLKNHGRVGSSLKFEHKYVGYNSKTTEFMSGMALSELRRITEIISRRQSVAKRYVDNIKNVNLFPFPFSPDCSYLGFPIKAITKDYRDKVINKLTNEGIETREMFPCLANQEAYHLMFDQGVLNLKLPVSQDSERRCFYIPCHQYLTDKQVDNIIAVINND